jgi:hypothetical protein
VNRIVPFFVGMWSSGMDALFIREPDSLRLRVPAALRLAVRQDLAGARACLREANNAGPGARRDEAALCSFRTLLSIVGTVSTSNPLDPESVIATGASIVGARSRRPSDRVLSLAREPSPAAPLTASELRDVIAACERTDALIDTRSDRARRLQRQVTWLALILTAAIAARASLGPSNLAPDGEVTASSICSATLPPPPFGSKLGRVADGVRFEGPGSGEQYGNTSFAVCTGMEVHPWVQVDLHREHVLTRALVYGRSDCCWGDELPLAIQVSSDGQHFESVAVKDTPLTAAFAWNVSLGGRKARYVRLYNTSTEARSITLSELEVDGY